MSKQAGWRIGVWSLDHMHSQSYLSALKQRSDVQWLAADLSVAQALRVHSDAMRTQRYHKAEELAAKLPVKLMFPLILFIFPAIIVVIVGPAAIQIYNTIITR